MLALAMILAAGMNARADIKTWIASPSTNNWATAANWGGTAPVAGDRLMFQTSTVITQYNDLASALNFDGVTFSNGASAFNLNGNSITLDGVITNNASNIQAINFPIALSGDRTIVGAAGTLVINGAISGGYALTKLGAGALALAGSNTYSGGLTVSAGTVNLNNSNAAGTGILTLSGGTIQNTSTNSQTVTNSVVAQSGTTSTLQISSYDLTLSGNLSGLGNLTTAYAGSGAHAMILSGTNSGYTGACTVNNNSNVRFRFASSSAGSSNAVWVFNNNTTDGQSFTFGNGTIYFGSFSGYGQFRQDSGGTTVIAVGSLGSNDTFSGTINQSGGGNLAILAKVGSGTMTLSGASTFTGGVQANGGILVFSNASAFGASGNITFGGGIMKYGAGFTNDLSARFANSTSTMAVNDNGQNVTYASAIATNNIAGLTKLGTGTMTLSATNLYTGATTVSNGTLLVNGAIMNSPLVVASNAVLRGSGLLATNVTLAGGASFSQIGTVGGALALLNGPAVVTLQNGVANTLIVSNGLTLANGNVLNFDLATPAGSDKIAVIGGSYSASGIISLNLTNLTGFGVGSYPLITGATGIATDNFTLATTPSAAYNYVLDASTGTLSVVVTLAGSTPGTAYWTGSSDASWTTVANWATNSAGTQAASGVPGDVSTVIFAADNGANFNTTLGADFAIKNLAYTTASNTVIGGGNTLTIAEGITVNSGAGTNTLSAPVTLAVNQAWNNNSANPLVLNGTVSGSGKTLTLAGSGVVQLGASDRLDNGASLVVSNGTFDLAANSDTVGGVQVAGNVAGPGTLTSTTAFDLRSGTVSAALAGSVAVTKTTAGTIILSATNTFTGGVTINGGTVRLAAPEATGLGGPLGASGAISFGGGVLEYGAVNSNDYSGRFSTSGSQAVNVDLNAQTVQFGTGLTSSNGSLTVSDSAGGGRLTLAAAGTYKGGTILNGLLTLVQGVDGALGSTNASLTVSNGTVDVNGYSLGIGALSGNGTILNNGGFPAILTVGNSNVTFTSQATMADGISPLAVVKAGTGVWTLQGTNTYSGGMTLRAGTLDLWNSRALGTNTFTLAGGVLQNTSGSEAVISNNVVAQAGTATSLRGTGASNGNALAFRGNISGSGALTVDSDASWYPYVTLSGDNSGFTGTFTINGNNQGRMSIASTNSGSANAAWVLNNGADDCPNFGFTGTIKFGSLSGGGGWGIRSGGAITLEVGALNTNSTFSGTLGGKWVLAASLTKVGTGTLTLSGANTYSGATTISNGALCVNGSLGASSAVSVYSNATLSGTGTVNGVVTTVAGSKLSPGLNAAGTLTLNKTPVLNGGVVVVNVTTNGTNGVLAVTGSLAVTNMALQVADISKLDKAVTSYTIATATNVVGPFVSHNLPPGWGVQVSTTDIKLVQRVVGAILIVQ